MPEDQSMNWYVSISGEAENPERDRVTVIRYDLPRIFLEVDAPGVRSAGDNQPRMVRQAIQDALNALQEALDTLSALPGL
jgi:hypothetical protein